MNILERLHEIEKFGRIYDIHYCNAGIGFMFYEPPAGVRQSNDFPNEWKEYLVVHCYYPTFEEAVEAEWNRLCKICLNGGAD